MRKLSQFIGSGNFVALAGGILSATMIAVIAASIWQSWDSTRDAASHNGENLAAAIEGDVARMIARYDRSLRSTIDGLNAPLIRRQSPEIQQMLLFGQPGDDTAPGDMLALDAKGDIVVDGGFLPPRKANFADRAYFKLQRENPDLGLYISQPLAARLEPGQTILVFSRRISGQDGSFEGAAVGTLNVDYFKTLFSQISLGWGGSLTIFNKNGVILMRQPSADGHGDVGRDISGAENFKRILAAGSGSFISASSIDKVSRLFTFRQIADQPLYVVVAQAESTVFAQWRRRTFIALGVTLSLCAALIGLTLMLRREFARRTAMEALLASMAMTDALTGLANRRHFDAHLHEEWRRAARLGVSISLLFIDVDHFKAFNDRYGHLQGDQVLRVIGQILSRHVGRPGDLSARYGGEEFAVILPHTDTVGAMLLAEQLRGAMERTTFGGPDAPGPVTISIGVATMKVAGDDERRLIDAADTALYRAKEAGRNRVMLAAPPDYGTVSAKAE